MTDEPEDPLAGFTGDHASALVLRRSLRALADEQGDSPLGRRVRDVLAGRRGVRSLAEDPEFAEITREGMAAHQAYWSSLTPEQRAEQLREGETYLAGLEGDPDRPPRRRA